MKKILVGAIAIISIFCSGTTSTYASEFKTNDISITPFGACYYLPTVFIDYKHGKTGYDQWEYLCATNGKSIPIEVIDELHYLVIGGEGGIEYYHINYRWV